MKKLLNKITVFGVVFLIIFSLYFHAFATENIYNNNNNNNNVNNNNQSVATNNNNINNNNVNGNNNLNNNQNGNQNNNNNNNINQYGMNNAFYNTNNNKVRTLTLEEQRKQVRDHLKEANEKLTYVENELSIEVLQIAQLEDKIAKYEADLKEVNLKYQQIYNEVQASELRLKEVTDVYVKQDKLLRKRLTKIYKNGTTSYLDVLLSSADVIDFISNYYTVQKIVENDTRKLRQIQEKKQQIEKINNELLEKKANMKIMKARAESQSVVLENTKTVLETHKQSLTDSQKQLVAEIDAYKKQEAEINTMIANRIFMSSYDLQYSGGVMLWPTLREFYVTSPFGSRVHPIRGIVRNHAGLDISGPGAMGKPIFAAKNGLVIHAGVLGGYGNCVMIDHGLDDSGVKIVTLYGHGSKIIANVGDKVNQGDIIMEIGSTGMSTGPHVHFEVRENGVPVDPKKYLQG